MVIFHVLNHGRSHGGSFGLEHFIQPPHESRTYKTQIFELFVEVLQAGCAELALVKEDGPPRR